MDFYIQGHPPKSVRLVLNIKKSVRTGYPKQESRLFFSSQTSRTIYEDPESVGVEFASTHAGGTRCELSSHAPLVSCSAPPRKAKIALSPCTSFSRTLSEQSLGTTRENAQSATFFARLHALGRQNGT